MKRELIKMASSKSIINAAKDEDVRLRAIALAAELGVDSPEAFIDAQRYQLASAEVTTTGDTVASVYEFAEIEYETAVKNMPKPPGRDDAKLTDEHLRFAIRKLANLDVPPPTA